MQSRLFRAAIMAIFVCLVSFPLSKSISQAEQFIAPLGESGTFSVMDSKVATINVNSDLSLAVYPIEPVANSSGERRYFYEVNPVIAYRSPDSFYNPDSRILEFDIIVSQVLDEVKLEKARQEIVGVSGDPNSVLLLPLPLQAVQVLLYWNDESLLIKEFPTDDGPYDGRLPIGFKVTSETLHQKLQTDPSSIRVAFRPFYTFRVFDVSVAKGQLESSFRSEIIEKVFGKSNSDARLVTRDALSELKQQAESIVNIVLPNNASSVQLHVLDIIESRIDKLLLTPEQVAASEDKFFYKIGDIEQEIAPEIFHEIVNSWKTTEEFKQSLKESWDNLHELATQASSASDYYKKVSSYTKGSGSVNAKANIILKAIPIGFEGGGSQTKESTYEELTSDQKQTFDKFYEQARNSGEISEEIYSNISNDFYGTRDYTKITPKNLQIYRISKTDLQAVFSIAITEFQELQSILSERTKFIPLFGSATVVSVDLNNLVDKLTPVISKALRDDASFMADVEGPQGDSGVNGKDGRDGRDGRDGANGTDGKNGKNGSNATICNQEIRLQNVANPGLVIHLHPHNNSIGGFPSLGDYNLWTIICP